MSAMSSSTSHFVFGPAPLSRTSTPATQWVCQACKIARKEEHVLVQSDGHMVCPSCALIDTTASSAKFHVDLTADQSYIFDPLQSLQTLDAGWAYRAQKQDRRFMAQVDTLMTTFLTHIVGNSSSNIQNGVKLWFRDIQEADKIDKGAAKLTQFARSGRIAVMMALAVRMAVQEVNLTSIYNRLNGKAYESRNAVKGYTKGDDRVPVLSHLEFFAKNQELALADPARFKGNELYRDIQSRFYQILDYHIAPCDYVMSLVLRVQRHLIQLINASPEERRTILNMKEGQKGKTKGWPDVPLDHLKRVTDWDEVIRMAHDLWQAQNCVLLFAEDTPTSQAGAAVALTLTAAETVIGDCVPTNIDALTVQLGAYLDIGMQAVRIRRPELERFILCWSTSLPEAGLPTPPIKRLSKRSSQKGGGLSGWGSDKRRSIPTHVIMPLATRAIATHWQALKQARLKRPGVIPVLEEITLAKKLFAGNDIGEELAELLAKHSGAATSAEDDTSDDGTETGSETEPEATIEPSTRGASSMVSEEHAAAALLEATEKHSSQPVNKPDTVQSWIENGDASSGDEGNSSDDDTPRPAKRVRREPTHPSIGELPQPFAFSVGQKGFQIEKVATPAAISVHHARATASPMSASAQRSESVDTLRSEDGLTAASDACPMERQLSSTSSRSMTSTSQTSISTSSITSHPAPLRATASPAPVKIMKGERVSLRAEVEAVQRGLKNPNDHAGVLVRERKVYCSLGPKRQPVRGVGPVTVDDVVIRSINFWLDKQKEDGLPIPDLDSQEYLKQARASTNGNGPIDVRDRIIALADRQSPLETLLRLGVQPADLPYNMIPHSACGVNLALFHFADSKAVLGKGDMEETEDLRDKSLRLFFRGPANDSLPDAFLDTKGIKERIQSYHYKGYWDCLADNSPLPKPKFRVRKLKMQDDEIPENMIQRIAQEEGKKDFEGDQETEMIQKAVLGALLYHKFQPIWDPFKVTGSVPKLWFDDGLYELGLVPSSKLSAAEAWETAEVTWARRKKDDEAAMEE